MFSFSRFLNFFILNKNQKKFIKHNYETFVSHKKNNLNKKIILIEINETVENTIAFSYIANQLSNKYDATITAYFPRIPRGLSRKIIWKFRRGKKKYKGEFIPKGLEELQFIELPKSVCCEDPSDLYFY